MIREDLLKKYHKNTKETIADFKSFIDELTIEDIEPWAKEYTASIQEEISDMESRGDTKHPLYTLYKSAVNDKAVLFRSFLWHIGTEGFMTEKSPLSTLDSFGELVEQKIKELFSDEPYQFMLKTDLTSKLGETKITGKQKTDIAGTLTQNYKNIEILFPNYENTKGLRTTTQQLLDFIALKCTKTGDKTLDISLKEFIKLRGLKDTKEAKKNIDEDILTLSIIKVKLTDSTGTDFVSVIQKTRLWNNGSRTVQLSDDLYNSLRENPAFSLYPVFLLKINSKKNPNSYYFGKKLADYKNQNAGKSNENVISVKSLLKASPEIAPYNKKHFKQLILNPFIRDMNELTKQDNSFSWGLLSPERKAITKQGLQSLNYDIFINSYVKYNWEKLQIQKKGGNGALIGG